MKTFLFSKQKYLRYLIKAKNANNAQRIRDLLYTFINYYRHLGQTVMTSQTGANYALIVNAFQQVIRKYHLDEPLTNLNKDKLVKAIKPSIKAIQTYYYVANGKAKVINVNVRHIPKEKIAYQKILKIQSKIYNGQNICLDMTVDKSGATFVTVPKKNLVKQRS